MTTPEGNPSEDAADRPAWGQQPAGGWGDPSGAPARDATRADPNWSDPTWADPNPAAPTWSAPTWSPTAGDAPGGPWAPPPATWAAPPYGGGQAAAGAPRWGGEPAPPAWSGPANAEPRWSGEPTSAAAPPSWNARTAWGGPGSADPYAQPQPRGGGPGHEQWTPGGAPAWARQPPPGAGWAPTAGQQPRTGDDPHGTGQWYQPGHPSPAYPPLPRAGSAPRRSPAPWIIGAVVAAAALLAVLAFVAPGFLRTTVFDQVALQEGVQRVLTDSYRITGVDGLVCGDPARGPIAVRTGESFTCTATVDGTPVSIPVTITSDGGDYEVGPPA